ncbi:MAG TPA: UDP-N-acetylglucosamine 2-epimerase (non-hydrolyzing) [Gaiella sp.]|nr:UDP-N-acetylglucosamine 2-epimerase (non-hydrolyzing) [Gaiella sp.]
MVDRCRRRRRSDSRTLKADPAAARYDMAQHRLLYVVGARPNFVKMAPVVAELRRRLPDAEHVVVHTGQHYAAELSEVFIDQLELPEPAHRLEVGSGSHAEQTGRVMERLERVVSATRPDLAFVAGDVNSTLASSLVLAKLEVPYAHVESGLRSFDRSMPEEVNRIVADEFAEHLFAHSEDAVENLRREGIEAERIHLVGNTMIDTLCRLEPRFRRLGLAGQLGLEPGRFILVTLHRPALVDGPLLEDVLEQLQALANRTPVVFPLHPRTRARIPDLGRYPDVRFLEPVGYLEFLSLEADAGAVLTDSGGVQEETTFLGVPCFTLRPGTERPVTTRLGTNVVLGLDPRRIPEIVRAIGAERRAHTVPPLWDGRASERIADIIGDRFR